LDFHIINNEINQQFEIHAEGHAAEMIYRLREDSIYLMQTKVPSQLEKRGIGGALAEHALNYAKEKNLEVVIYCPFVKAYLEKKRSS